MDEKQKREKSLAEAALLLGPDERCAFLAQVSGADAQLRQRIEARIQTAEQGGASSQDSTLTAPGGTINLPLQLTARPGDRIGRYKVLEQIGEGGCGVVYVAEQEQPVRRRVALKVIKLGMDTRQVIARFEAERQALALMDHPNIAKVLDAGATEAGRPFFVMELVRGIKITDYCDQNKLSTEDRLKLFIRVCQAVQHAHQKGIIHRDIKPSNILVTLHDGVPVPKVIDFGIAKATTDQKLTDKTVYTALEQFIGTPAYMSPEQAEMSGLDIDTRTDIYSLGVLLYELLTGETPFDCEELLAQGVEAMRRALRENDPARPSTRLSTMLAADLTRIAQHRQSEAPKLVRSVRGDLDWIVMKTLEKNRTRRYDTANGLAMDIQRHLNNEPIIACPPSNLYKFQKLVRRNKLAFAATGAIAMALFAGLALSAWGLVNEQQARREAERQRQKAEANEKKAQAETAKSQQVTRFLEGMLGGVGPSVALGRDTTMLREILDKTAERVGNELAGEPDVEAHLRNTIGHVYDELGAYTNAETMLRQALALHTASLGGENSETAASLDSLGYVLCEENRLGEAETMLNQALALRRLLLGNANAETASSLHHLGALRQRQGRYPEAEVLYREAVEMHSKALGKEHLGVATSLDGLANALRREMKLDEAESTEREALAIERTLLGNNHPVVAHSLYNLAQVLRDHHRPIEAEQVYRDALVLYEKLLGKEHPDVASCLDNLGRALADQGKLAEAESRHRKAVAMQRRLLGGEHPDVAWSLNGLAGVLKRQGKLSEAEGLFREILRIRTVALPIEHVDVGYAVTDLISILRAQGKLAEVVLVCGELADRGNAVAQYDLGAMFQRGDGVAKDFAEAAKWYRKAAEWSGKAAGRGDVQALNACVWLLATCDNPQVRDGASAVRFAENAAARTQRKNSAVLDALAAAYAEAGDFSKAVAAQQEAILLLQNEAAKKDFASRLRLYELNTPYRQRE